jgi:hypothetical protein
MLKKSNYFKEVQQQINVSPDLRRFALEIFFNMDLRHFTIECDNDDMTYVHINSLLVDINISAFAKNTVYVTRVN